MSDFNGDWAGEMIRIMREYHEWPESELRITRRLLEADSISWREARRYSVCEQFFKLYKTKGADDKYRTARDIELELSVHYDLPLTTVRFLRTPRKRKAQKR